MNEKVKKKVIQQLFADYRRKVDSLTKEFEEQVFDILDHVSAPKACFQKDPPPTPVGNGMVVDSTGCIRPEKKTK